MVPLVKGGLLDPAHGEIPGSRHHGAKRRQRLRGGLDKIPNGALVRDVNRVRVSTDERGGLLGSGHVAVRHGDRGALGGEPLGDGAADSACAPHHERSAPGEPVHAATG
jgi:hypothetical protein